jgi:UDP-2,3-diacylglucosamine pyrophosphatase LpxH
MAPTLVVLSDCHIAAGKLDDCDAELEAHLVSFIESLCRRNGAVELVFNGDLLDFVQADPWNGGDLESATREGIPLCFSEDQSVAKLEAILRSHEPVFSAMNAFMRRRPDNVVTILPGNHDADFFWADVRSRFTEDVGPVQFVLEQVYRSPVCPGVWIEHGHQADAVNQFIWEGKAYWSAVRPPIFADNTGTPRLYECPGTRFLIKFLNHLDSEYPFVDNVKPFSRFLKVFGASAFAPGYGMLKVAMAVGRMLKYLDGTLANQPGDVLSAGANADGVLPAYVLSRFNSANPTELNALIQNMRERGFIAEMPLPMYLTNPRSAEPLLAFLGEHLDLLDGWPDPGDALMGDTIPGTLTMAAGFNADETGKLKDSARQALQLAGVELVVMGHTHETVREPLTSYINTGSWTRYYRFGADERTEPWELLKAKSYATFPYELNFVEIPTADANAGRLATYRSRHA